MCIYYFTNIVFASSNIIFIGLYPISNTEFHLRRLKNGFITKEKFLKHFEETTSSEFDKNVHINTVQAVNSELLRIQPMRYLMNENKNLFAVSILSGCLFAWIMRRRYFFYVINVINFSYNLGQYKKTRSLA